MWYNIRFGVLGAILFISNSMAPAVAGNPALVTPEQLSRPVVPAVNVKPVQVRQDQSQSETPVPVRKPSAKLTREVIKTPLRPALKAPVVAVPGQPAGVTTPHLLRQPSIRQPVLPVAPVARPTGRPTGSISPGRANPARGGFAPPPLPGSKRFGLNKPVTSPAGKSILLPGATGGPRHLLEGDAPSVPRGGFVIHQNAVVNVPRLSLTLDSIRDATGTRILRGVIPGQRIQIRLMLRNTGSADSPQFIVRSRRYGDKGPFTLGSGEVRQLDVADTVSADKLSADGKVWVGGEFTIDSYSTRTPVRSFVVPDKKYVSIHMPVEEPATLAEHGISAQLTDTLQPDLIIEDISLDASRRAVLVKWREANHRPLPAGEFNWIVSLGGARMASADRLQEAGDSLQRLPGTNPFRRSPDRSDDALKKPYGGTESVAMMPIGNGTVQVTEGDSRGQFRAPLDLYAGILRDQPYLTVEVLLNTSGRYPEASRDNDTFTKQIPYPRHTGSQLVPGEIPSQVIAVNSRPAQGREYVTVRYSLTGSRPGRLGIQWKIGGTVFPLDCYPNSGDGLTSAPPGLNQQLTFVCQIPVKRQTQTDRTENATITTLFYSGAGRRLLGFMTPAVLHFPHSTTDVAGRPDLDVQITLAQRYRGKPWVTVRVRNGGNAPSPQSRVVVDALPTDDGACRWPHGASKTIPVLAPGGVFDATLPGDYCHGEPGTYRTNAQADRINLTARIDTTGNELNTRNNNANRLLKDALRDSPAEGLVTRINSALLTDPPTESANCAYRDAHIRIDGGPFSAPITAELRTDVNQINIAASAIQVESGTRLVATIRGCTVLPGRRVEIRLHYANGRSSSWQNVQGLRLTEQRRSGPVKEIQEAP